MCVLTHLLGTCCLSLFSDAQHASILHSGASSYLSIAPHDHKELHHQDPLDYFPPAPSIKKHPSPRVRWVAKLNANVCGPAILLDDRVIVAGYDQHVLGISIHHAKVVQKNLLRRPPVGQAVVHREQIIFPQQNNILTSLSSISLRRHWDKTPKAHSELKASARQIFELNLFDGFLSPKQIQQGASLAEKLKLSSTVQPLAHQGDFIVATPDGALLRISPNASAEQKTLHQLDRGYVTAMKLKGDQLFLLTSEKQLIALDLNNQNKRWQHRLAGVGYHSITIHQDQLFVGAKNLYAFNFQGEELWTYQSSGRNGVCRGPILIQNRATAWFAEQEGTLLKVHCKSGDLLEKISLPIEGEIWNPMVVYHDNIAISSTQKELCIVNIKDIILSSYTRHRME